MNALVRFLENSGEDFLSWRDGCIVVDTYHDKQFRALGGDTNRLISFFKDCGTMEDAARHYIASLQHASEWRTAEERDWPIKAHCLRCDGKGTLFGADCLQCLGRGYYFLPLGN